MDNQYDKRIRRARRRLERGNTHRFTQKNTKKLSNWKTPDHDVIHGFWFKKFTSIHERPAIEINRCLQGVHLPEWINKGNTTLIQKDPLKGTARNNYRLISRLPMTWKNKGEKIYCLLTSRGLFLKETERMLLRIQRHRRVTLHRSVKDHQLKLIWKKKLSKSK